jgi:hypothetical protein
MMGHLRRDRETPASVWTHWITRNRVSDYHNSSYDNQNPTAGTFEGALAPTDIVARVQREGRAWRWEDAKFGPEEGVASGRTGVFLIARH